mmetsp:Transcript_39184/g.118392  ORF Transcript_39184/g.118392 Transcript_39184/m.118392 type:complete len:301 (+) Transcript_39184:1931-2833(+)
MFEGVEGARVRGHEGQQGQLPRGLQHGEPGSDGHPHWRVCGGRAFADAHQRRVQQVAGVRDQGDSPLRHRGRGEHPVRLGPQVEDLPDHRGQPPPLAEQRAGLEGDGLPAGVHRGEDRARPRPRVPAQLGDEVDHGVLRAVLGLLCGQGAALGHRQVPNRGEAARHADEVGRRGHVHRPVVPGGHPEGHAHGQRGLRWLRRRMVQAVFEHSCQRGGCCRGPQGGAHAGHPAPALGGGAGLRPGHVDRRGPQAHGHRPVVPRQVVFDPLDAHEIVRHGRRWGPRGLRRRAGAPPPRQAVRL